MTDTPTLDRRNVLKALGGAAGLGMVGGGAYLAVSPAAAQATIDVSISGTEISNDMGTVDWVGVDVDKTIAWDGFDVPVEYIGFKHEITLDDGGDTPWHVLYDKTSDHLDNWSSEGSGSDGWGGPGEYVVYRDGDKGVLGLEGKAHADVSWAIISDGSHPSGYDSVQTPVDWTDTLSEPEDGVTTRHVVRFKTTLTFYTAVENDNGELVPEQITADDGIPDVSGEDSFAVDVVNEVSETTDSGGNTTSESGTSTGA